MTLRTWVEVTEKRNLESTIQRVLRTQHVRVLSSDDKTKTHIKRVKLDKRQILRRVSWVFLIACVLCLVVMIIINSTERVRAEALNDLKDARLVPYEAHIYTAKKVSLLFRIGDEESYQTAKQSVSMSDDLKASYFLNDHYRGTVDKSISVELNTVLYEITEESEVNYLLYLTRRTSTGSKQYIVQATYTGDTLVGLRVLN